MTSDRNKPQENKGSINEGTLVIIEDYDPENHRVKVKRFKDNKPLEPDRTSPKPVEQRKLYDLKDKRTLKVDDDPKGPIIEATANYVRMGGNNDHGFFSFKEGGNIIKGPLSLVAMPNEIRLSALTTLNPLIISGFPSTIVTPLPTCVWSIPGASAVKPLLKSVLMASTLIAAAGIS